MTTNVLVVDDSRDIRDLLAAVLQDEEYSVQLAEDGAAALRSLERATPQLIILDLMMPVMGGAEFMREYRRAGGSVPVLLLSAYGAREARDVLGANDAIAKPFDIDELVTRVRALLLG